MFSSSHKLRNVINGNEVERRSVSPTFNTLNESQTLPKDPSKIESNGFHGNISLKTSFISECDNSSIYEWRKREKAPIVRVIDLGSVNETNRITGISLLQKTIRAESFEHTLKTYTSFTKEEMLFIFKSMLEGQQAIFRMMRATSACLENCMITTSGEVRVWINPRFERNEIVGKVLDNEEDIVKKIFEDFILLASNNKNGKVQEFIEYLRSTLRKTKKWTFASLNAMVKSYIDCLKLKLPKKINFEISKNVIKGESSLNGSFVSQEYPKLKKERRQNSFLCVLNDQNPMNLQSGALRRLSYNLRSGTKEKNFSALHKVFFNKTVTSKSIKENNASTLRSLTIKSNNSSSVSNFTSSTVKDCLSQKVCRNSKQSLVINGEKERKIRRISGVEKILIHEIGIPILREALDEDCSSPTVKKSFASSMTSSKKDFEIVSQFGFKVELSIPKSINNSSISTANQTSDSTHNYFAKKIKESISTITEEEKKENCKGAINFFTASRDRFEFNNVLSERKTINSCTNWSNRSTLINLNSNSLNNHEKIKEVEASTIFQTNNENEESPILESFNNRGIHSNKSLKGSHDCLDHERFVVSSMKSQKEMMKESERKDFKKLVDLAVKEEAESYYHTDKNSSSDSRSSSAKIRSKMINSEDKVIELTSFNRNLFKSTHMETNSERKISNIPKLEGKRKLKEMEETLDYIMKAKVKQEEVIEENCWTKKMDKLFEFGEKELKQSINLDSTGKGFKEIDSSIHEEL